MRFMTLKVIAYARNGHKDKFGIPRQSREESPILTRIVFEPEFAVPEALRGIEGYSHLWILWGFSEVESQKSKVESDWSPTVRPPRLGGNTRMGVFATRSPYRPNPIGLSSVRLIEVRRTERTKDVGLELVVSGADVLDGTPIYDIKPYLSFSDCHEDAKNGFAEETRDYKLKVDWTDIGLTLDEQPANNGLRTRLSRANNALLERITHDETEEIKGKMKDDKIEDIEGVREEIDGVKEEIEYILSQDPRPGYQDDPEREYKLDYKGWNVTFTVINGTVFVKRVVLVESRKSKVESK